MNKRLTEIRKSKNLTMEEFGLALGVTKTAISRLEKGERNLTEQMIKLICREFNINEEWLRTGKGTMQKPEANEIVSVISNLLEHDNPLYEIIKDIMLTYNKLDDKSRNVIDQFIEDIFHMKKSQEQNRPITVEEAEAAYIKSRSHSVQNMESSVLNTIADTNSKAII